jgi:hypothetical protein
MGETSNFLFWHWLLPSALFYVLIGLHRSHVQFCKSVYSRAFYVYTAKKFPGMEGTAPFHSSHLPWSSTETKNHVQNLHRCPCLFRSKASRYEFEKTLEIGSARSRMFRGITWTTKRRKRKRMKTITLPSLAPPKSTPMHLIV